MSAHSAAFALVRQQESRRRRPVTSLAPARRLRTARGATVAHDTRPLAPDRPARSLQARPQRGAAVGGHAAQRTEGTR